MRIFFLTFLTLLSFVCFFAPSFSASRDCEFSSDGKLTDFITSCAQGEQNAIAVGGANDPNSIKNLIIKIANNVISFGALIAIGFIVYSGIQYTMSYGDDEKIKKAKTTGIYAIIGLFLLLLAFPIVNMLISFIYALAEKN